MIAFIARTGERRALYVLERSAERDPQKWKAQRIDIVNGGLPSGVIACAGAQNGLYVALKDRGILKLGVGQEYTGRGTQRKLAARVRASGGLDGPAGPLTFSALAVGDIQKHWEVLYAVAGDDAVYRFDSELRPDQRIEWTLPGAPGPQPDR